MSAMKALTFKENPVMERNEACVNCGRKYFKKYAKKMGVNFSDEEIEKLINYEKDNIRTDSNIFPLIWYRAGLILEDEYKFLSKTGVTKPLNPLEIGIICSADPEKMSKREANKKAGKIIESIKVYPLDLKERIKLSTMANQALDSYAGDFETDPKAMDNLLSMVHDDFFIDHTQKLIEKINKISGNYAIGFIPDNAGEVVFDKYLTDFLRKNGVNVKIVVAKTPRWDDVTAKECKRIFGDYEILPSKALCKYDMNELNKIAEDRQIDFFVAKGIVNMESYTKEIKIPLFNLFATKCDGSQIYFEVDGIKGVVLDREINRR